VRFPDRYAEMWDSMNMQPPTTAWDEMDTGERYDLLRHALDESIWSLVPAATWDEASDSQKVGRCVRQGGKKRLLHAEIIHDNRPPPSGGSRRAL